MTPVKLVLIEKDRYSAKIKEEGLSEMAADHCYIRVTCSGPQAFAEIVTRLLESHLAVAAVQQAIHCLQMAKSPADRVEDMRMLQDVHFKMTGLHFDSAAQPAPIEGVEPSSGSVSMEQGRKMWGELDPAKIEKMSDSDTLPGTRCGMDHVFAVDFPGMTGSKMKFVTDERVPRGGISADEKRLRVDRVIGIPGTKVSVIGCDLVAHDFVAPGEVVAGDIVPEFHPKALKEDSRPKNPATMVEVVEARIENDERAVQKAVDAGIAEIIESDAKRRAKE